jgi:regulator of nucleoside diphosphate kinase
MRASNFGERRLTEPDFTRLKKLTAAGALPQLDDILDESEVVPAQAIPPDVVTMYSRFVVRDLKLERRQILVVCYPSDAEPAKGHISVLSPAAMGLLGLPEGAVARWNGPGGTESVAQIERIVFQPEATGDYVTWWKGEER